MAVMLDVTVYFDGFPLHPELSYRSPLLNRHDTKVLRSISFKTGLGTTYALN
jgi:hypothetical protein